MTFNKTLSQKLAASVVAALLGGMLTSAAQAQVNPPANNTQDGRNCTAAQAVPPGALPQKRHRLRNFFASTLAIVLHTASGGIVGTLNGRLMDWFEGKGYRPTEGFPAVGANPTQPDPTLATAADPYAGAQTNVQQPCDLTTTEQIYDARTGELVNSGDSPYATSASGNEGALYAGIAYEVHALAADGRSTPINPATHVFSSGDKFMVYYRPSLPGRMEVYNINPAGEQSLIQSANMAAGQLTRLGPYQFTRLTGDDSLKLVLSPCSNPQLLAATRDIVQVDAGPEQLNQPNQTSGAFQLSNCDAPTTRDLEVRTRDIEMVGVDDLTTFALDPVSQEEQGSGLVAPRETTIMFHSR